MDYNIDINIESDIVETSNQMQQNTDIRSLLLKKYSTISRNRGSLDAELKCFNTYKDEVADVLAFWRAQESIFPIMAEVAKVMLFKPATSAKSENAFSGVYGTVR